MATPPISDDALIHTCMVWLRNSRNRIQTAIELSFSKPGLDNRIKQAQVRGILIKDKTGRWAVSSDVVAQRVFAGSGAAMSPSPLPLDREPPQPQKARYRIRADGAVEEISASSSTDPEALDKVRDGDRIRRLERELKDAQRALSDARQKIDTINGLKDSILDGLDWTIAPAFHGQTELYPLLFTSDFQCGEVIKPEEIDGINSYNMEIFAERYYTLIERTIDLATHHVGSASFPGIIYCRGGDAISGEIHDELARTNDLSACPAVRWLVRHEREGIEKLRDRFGRVRVISIPGNHGRTTVKPHSKGYVDLNYESLISWWLETLFDKDPNVTFDTPRSGDAYFPVAGWNVLMSHGDRMGSRGGQGFIGPVATIARGHKKLFDNWSLTGRKPDVILTGHMHTSLRLELGFANGCLSGYSEYARDFRATPDGAKQWLLFFHQQRKTPAMFEVQVSDIPKRNILSA